MDASFVTAIASIVVATVAASSAYASQHSATNASTRNAQTASRTDMEREAYERARAFDTETIHRQEDDISELREENKGLKKDLEGIRVVNQELRRQLRACVIRIARLERSHDSEHEEVTHTEGVRPDAHGQPGHQRWYDAADEFDSSEDPFSE